MPLLEGRTLTPGLDVIIVAGGRGSRMDGRDKASVVVDGERLVDIMLDELSTISDLMQVVVVTTRGLEVRPGVKIAEEDPPFAGPLAAIDAGVRVSGPEASAQTAILAVDAPESPQLIDDLKQALAKNPEASAAVIRAEDGYLQPLCALWRTDALHSALEKLTDNGALSGLPVKALINEVTYTEVTGTGEERDYDTLEELADYGELESD